MLLLFPFKVVCYFFTYNLKWSNALPNTAYQNLPDIAPQITCPSCGLIQSYLIGIWADEQVKNSKSDTNFILWTMEIKIHLQLLSIKPFSSDTITLTA